MALQLTIKQLRALLGAVTSDLDKAENGNKAASQRVRTGTVKLEKIGKVYRKESIAGERGKGGGSRKAAKKAAPKASKASHKPASKAAHKPAPKAAHKAAPKAKVHAKAKTTKAKARPLSVKRATAKLPRKARSFR